VASLTAAAGAFEPDTPAQFSPVRRIECTELPTDWHVGYAATWPSTR
jgi:hypothetical protein